MTTRADYSTPEWNTLQAAIVGAGFYVHRLTPGFFANWRAKRAGKDHVNDVRETGDILFEQLCDTDDFISPFPKHVKKSTVAVEAFVLQAVDEALNILSEKDPQALVSYKKLILDIAQETAQEVNGVSLQEREALDKIKRVVTGDLDFKDSWRLAEPYCSRLSD